MENNLPLISVIMAVFNGEKFIAQCVKSVLDQTVSDFEFLIVDDFSIDQTVNIIESFNDPRIRLFKNSSNRGLPASLNHLLDYAQGKYIARMDADDYCHKNRFRWQVAYLEKHSEVSLCGMWAYQIENQSKSIHRVKLPTRSQSIKSALFWGNCIPHPSVMARATFFKKNKYDIAYSKSQDYELWQRTSQINFFSNLPKFGIYYRISDQQISNKFKGDQNKFCEKVQERSLQLLVNASDTQIEKHLIIANQKEFVAKEYLFEWCEHLINANKAKQVFEYNSFTYYTFRVIGLNLIKFGINYTDIFLYLKKMIIWRVISTRLFVKLIVFLLKQVVVKRK